MKIPIILETQGTETSYAPLAVLGYCLTKTHFLDPVWREMRFRTKAYRHQGIEKLQDILVSILAGNDSISQVNTRIRPDIVLASAWGREQFAEQSTLSRILDDLSSEQINQLRAGCQALFREMSHTMRHEFEKQLLILDMDPTYIPAARCSEGSQKCYSVGKKNQFGRQWNRISAPLYNETILSMLFPGNYQGCTMLKRSMKAVQQQLGFSDAQRKQIVIRSDASLGTDANINWLLWAKYQVLMKGFSGPRAVKLAKQVPEKDWIADPLRKRWIARAPHPPRFARSVDLFVIRWENQLGLRYGTLVSTLGLDPEATLRLYDQRGAVEVEIKTDKQGLKATKRRKHHWQSQEALILLTDLAHNLLSWFHHWVLENGAFDAFGTKRIVCDLMSIPGRITEMGQTITMVSLWQLHPYASNMRLVLENLLNRFNNP